ncbi:helix-turn-helix transcriptional regulator (plasmid) [Sinorhizobium sp. B11]
MMLSQRAAATRANVTHRYISTAETSESLVSFNLELVDFYVSQGIEFLGAASVGREVSRAGARWLAPISPEEVRGYKRDYHVEEAGISFRAARAMLGHTREQVAEEANLSVAVIRALESGEQWQESTRTLQAYYERKNIEFLGWSDASSKLFYGVGVRWSAERAVEGIER